MRLKKLIAKTFMMGVTLLIPHFAFAFGESSTIQNYVSRKARLPIIKPSWGDFLLHTDSLNQLYVLREYQAIWVNGQGRPNELAIELKRILLAADRHGLNPIDYWDQNVDALYTAAVTNQNNWITFELAASEALLRFAKHLSVGRVDPSRIDTDIKFKKRQFSDFKLVEAAIESGLQGLAGGLDKLAPTHSRYTDLMDILVQLRAIQKTGGWVTLNSPGFVLKLGVRDPIVQQIRDRFNQLGYKISNAGGNLFDSEFETVLKKFQSMNGMMTDGIIGTRSEVLRHLNVVLNQRIIQVEANMEKLRWLPQDIEPRHIFVNLAMTEFKLQDESGEIMTFKTINGDVLHRTPVMKDKITYVDLNPTWTVPTRLAVKETLPKLQKDPRYLEKNDMFLFDAKSGKRVDPSTINWFSVNESQFPYVIQQNSGIDNVLGVVKFPLQNPWAIYLHDTNLKDLFAEHERHLSHGCVRLEKPLDLAAYLLKDQPEWGLDALKAFVPGKEGDQSKDVERKVSVHRPLNVYLMYLTVEKSKDGEMRFVKDVYGQDARLAWTLYNRNPEVKGSMVTASAHTGTLQVAGTPGKFQIFHKVKAVRCDLSHRGACDPAVVFDLNQQQSLPAGDYIVGFENTLYPGVVHLNQGEIKVLNLKSIKVPHGVRGQKVRVYRDYGQVVEQQKILLEMFAMNHHFQRLDAENFGELYEAGLWERDYVQRFKYDICPRLTSYGPVAPEAVAKCAVWNGATSAQDLSPLFQFNGDGTMTEFWVTYPGDVIPMKHPRYLVSAPMTESDFVSVFPGAYKFQAEGEGGPSVAVKVGNDE